MHLGAVTGYFRTLCNCAMNAKIGAADVKWEFKFLLLLLN